LGEAGATHSGLAVSVLDVRACKIVNQILQSRETDNEESMIQNNLLTFCKIESLIVIQIARKIYSPSDVARETGISSG
jgi:hypothetical protein